jgi:hypothetical protein
VPRAADRPRDGRYPVGQAGVRTHPPYYGGYYPSHPVYYPWYGYGALGLGYFYYDPFWWGYPGWSYPYWGYYPYSGYYGSYYGGYSGSSVGVSLGYSGDSGYYGSSHGYGTGHLRLKVKPRDAEVFVDGYYVGLVDQFDGTFQKLDLDTGPHRVEVRKLGFATMSFDVRIPYDETVTYRGELRQQK